MVSQKSNKSSLSDIHSVHLKILSSVDKLCRTHNIPYWIDFGTLLGAIRHNGFIPWDDDIDISMPRNELKKFLSIAQNQLSEEYLIQTLDTDNEYDIIMVDAKIRDKGSIFIEKLEADYHQGIYIDIFAYDKTFRNNKKRKRHQWMFRNFISGYKQNIISNRNIFTNEKLLRKIILSLLYKIIPFESIQENILSLAKHDSDWIWRPTLASKYDDYIVEDSTLFPLREITFEGVKTFIPNDPQKHLDVLYGNWRSMPDKKDRVPAHHIYSNFSEPWSLDAMIKLRKELNK